MTKKKQNRTETIKIRVTPDTKQKIQDAATVKDETISEFVRKAVLRVAARIMR